MAKTNARTQMMIGAILDELVLMMDKTWIDYFIEDRLHRFSQSINTDEDFQKAREIIENMINREINKNQDRISGAEAENTFFK